jgi:hypothetical protein
VASARVITGQIRQTPEFRAIAGNILNKPWPWPGSLSDGDRAWQRLRAPVAVLPEAAAERLGVPPGTIAALTGYDAPKMAIQHQVALGEYELAQQVLDAPDAVRKRDGKVAFYKRIGGRVWIAVLKVTGEGEVFLNSFHGWVTANRFRSELDASTKSDDGAK